MQSRSSKKAFNGEGLSGKGEASPARKTRRISTPHRPAEADKAAKVAKVPMKRKSREWPASLPTALERDTLLTPEWVAESVVHEAERYLGADLPPGYAERLAAKAHHLYPRHKHFHKMLNRPGNRGRHNLYVYMRHWTCSWLKRERYALYKKLPWSFALGVALYSRRVRTPEPGRSKGVNQGTD